MKKYLIVAHRIVFALFFILILLKITYNVFEIPGISDAPVWVYLLVIAPFLFIGLVSGIMQRKDTTEKTVFYFGSKRDKDQKNAEVSKDSNL